MEKYKIDFINFFNGDKRTITLGDNKTEAYEALKTVKKRFKWYWRKSLVYC